MLVKFCDHRRILLFFWDLIVVCCLNLVFYVDKFCPSGQIKNFRPLLKRKESKSKNQDVNSKNESPSPAVSNTNCSLTTQPQPQPLSAKVGHVKTMSSSLIVNLSSQTQITTSSISVAKGMSTSLSLTSLNIEYNESFTSSSNKSNFQQIQRSLSAECDLQKSSVEVDIVNISTSPLAKTYPIMSTQHQLESDLGESSENKEHMRLTESSLKGEDVTTDERSPAEDELGTSNSKDEPGATNSKDEPDTSNSTKDEPDTSNSTTKNDQELSQSELEDSYPVSPTSLTADNSRKSSLSSFATDLSVLLQSNIQEKEASMLWRSESFASLASQKDDPETPQEKAEDDRPPSTQCLADDNNTEELRSSFADDLAVLILSNVQGTRKKSLQSLNEVESVTSAQSHVDDDHAMSSGSTTEHDLVKSLTSMVEEKQTSVILKSEDSKELTSQSHNKDNQEKSEVFISDKELTQHSSVIAHSTLAGLSQQMDNLPEKDSEDSDFRSSQAFGDTSAEPSLTGEKSLPEDFSASKPSLEEKEPNSLKDLSTPTDVTDPSQSPPSEPDTSYSQIPDLDGATNCDIDPCQSLPTSNSSDVCIEIDKKDESTVAVSIEVPDVEITRF